MKILMAVHKKKIIHGGELSEKQGLGQFADLRTW